MLLNNETICLHKKRKNHSMIEQKYHPVTAPRSVETFRYLLNAVFRHVL
jgi:hypothetical protein